MSDPLLKQDGIYTYSDYAKWDGKKRYQLFDGEAYEMASPTVSHQALSGELLLQFGNFLRGKPCRVFTAPLDVRLFPKDDLSDRTVVQPDLLVVCDKTKLEGNACCRGAPDLVIEIVSPSNTHSELFLKFNYYLEAGVREYWVVNPEQRAVHVYVLDGARYIVTLYKENDVIPVSILPGLTIDLKTLWASAAGEAA